MALVVNDTNGGTWHGMYILGMSEKCEYTIAAYLALCHMFHIF